MYLENHDPEVFELFVTYLYRGSFAELAVPTPRTPLPGNKQISVPELHAANIEKLVKLYLMAENWDFCGLRNLCVDQIRGYLKKTGSALGKAEFQMVSAKVKNPASPLRRFAVDDFVWATKTSLDATKARQAVQILLESVSSTFVIDIVMAMASTQKPADPVGVGKCTYHEHPAGVRCANE